LGVVMLSLGALLLGDRLGFRIPVRLWELWPLVVVAVGAAKLVWARDFEDRKSGFWVLTGGIYCWISSWRLFGLHWGTAWPIFLIAFGLQIVLENVLARRADETIDSPFERVDDER
jgi:hypothetical protein